jgi:predicted nucleic acid-binding protein
VPYKKIVEFINYLYSDAGIEVVHVDRETHAAAWAIYTQYDDKEWSLVDASSFVLMRERGITEALTTDKHFVQAQFVRLPLGQ